MIAIINVDEYGKEISGIDWNIWERDWTEEVLEDDGTVRFIISHCLPIR